MRITDISPVVLIDRIWHCISRLIWDSDLIASRFTLAIAEFLWAIMLFLPGETFSSEKNSYLGIISESTWGFVFLFSGMIQTIIILYEHMNSSFAKMFSMFNALLWIYLVSSIIIDSYPPIIGVAGEIALMLTAVWIWVRPYILAEGLYRVGIR